MIEGGDGSRDRQEAGATLDDLERGRASHRRRAWADAHRWLARADRTAPLGAGDLELLAAASYLLGRDDDYMDALDRAHRAHLDDGDHLRAAACAFWLGFRLMFRGEAARSSGWLGRAQRLVERDERDVALRGYLMLPLAEQQLAAEEREAAHRSATSAAEIGERLGDADLVAFARHMQGRARVQLGQVEDGLNLLDEAMVAVARGELSPIVTGLLYCSVIDCCHEVHALGRAREWTSALAAWCDQQPDMVAFVGVCRVHRAEIMQRSGAWSEALEEARRAHERTRASDPGTAGEALYQQAEVHRLQGDLAVAEAAYRGASQCGRDPQPGLALLWLGQGRGDAAAAAIRRAVRATTSPFRRTHLLPAYSEIMLATGDVDEARAASRELDQLAASFGTDLLTATAAHVRGAVELAAGDAQAALGSLRRAGPMWRAIGAPHDAARVRVLIGLACQALGDDEGGRLELDSARAELARLGAAPDLARLDAMARRAPPGRPHGLTPRELEVLRLVAAGKTNRAIAAELRLSEKTVDRHVSNIFVKLDVPSRAAATAFAYQHKLI